MKKLEPMPNAHNEPGFDHAVEETSARQQCLCLPLLDMLPKSLESSARGPTSSFCSLRMLFYGECSLQ